MSAIRPTARRTTALRSIVAVSGAAALVLGALLSGCAGPAEDSGDPAVSGPAAGGEGGSVTQPPLGGRWVLVAGADADGVLVLPETPSNGIGLDLTTEGEVSGSGGCNTFSGTVADEPGEGATAALEFGPLMSTKMACADDAANALESRYLAALGDADAYSMTDGRLAITGPGGIELDFDQPPGEDE